jgi:hypothetical protein
MAVSAASERLDRLERFLDNINNVKSPSDLQEPFRSMWLRMHGERPTMMSEERREAFLKGGIGEGVLGDVQISAGSSPRDVKGDIEVISPKDVGPTVEMEVEDRKVTFKMAGDEDLKNIESKEEAANEMISLQGSIKPLSGLGGEVAKVWEGIRDVAQDYRAGNFIKALELGKSLKKFLDSEKFKKSVMLELQKKISEYEDLGGDTSKAKERFKDLASAMKEKDGEFINIAGEINNLAEESIKGIVEEEVVAEVKAEPKPDMKKKEEAPAPKRVLKKKVVPKLPKDTEEVEEEEEEEEKPVIKIVTVKKLVPVQKVRKEREEYKNQQKEDSTSEEEDIMELDEDEESEAPEPEPAPEEKVEDKVETETEPEPAAESKEAVKPQVQRSPVQEGPTKEEIQTAFKKYQFVYNASIKLNEKGKDVSQIFDLMNYAEQARQKGDLKAYVGVCNQMEQMLIKLQS